jgi:hypothetical protein
VLANGSTSSPTAGRISTGGWTTRIDPSRQF